MERSHRILHVVNGFDPAGDVVRCVAELKKYSRHAHELIVREPHPRQELGYPEAALMEWNCAPSSKVERREKQRPVPPCPLADHLMQWADGIIFHFLGQEEGWRAPEGKPAAFRNINIYWRQTDDAFWADVQYNARSLDGYKLISSSHVGARDFMPGDHFRWLPDLLPIYDPLYAPDFSPRPACVSYIKHSPQLKGFDFGAQHLNLDGTPHPQVLFLRKTKATVVIDNVCDGHFGLAGLEAMSLGLPVVVFNHEKTREELREMAPLYPPLTEVNSSVTLAAEAAKRLLACTENEQMGLRREMRSWMEAHWNSKRLIALFWDKFADELVG